MDITNQQWPDNVTIKMSGVEFIKLWHKLREIDLNESTQGFLSFYNSEGEQFDLNFVIEEDFE